MTILEVRIGHFGKLKDKQIPFRAGTNIITGNNETGKSTIAAFIKAMLYGLEEGEEEYQHYFPRFYEGKFGGSLKVQDGNAFYEIRRELSGAGRSLQVVDLSSGQPVEDPEEVLRSILGGIDRKAYEDSGFIGNESFASDAYKYRDTPEKREKAQREAEIKAHFLRARDQLRKTREPIAAQVDDSLETRRSLLNEEIQKTKETLQTLEKTIPETESARRSKANALTAETEKVRSGNEARERGFKQAMLGAKKNLAEYLANEKKSIATTNTFGVLLLVLGILGGLVTWFYCHSYDTTPFIVDHPMFVTVLILTLTSGIALIAGVIVTIMGFRKKRAAERNAAEKEELNRLSEEAEESYERYMNHREDYDDHVAGEVRRKEELDQLALEIRSMKERSDEAVAALVKLTQESEDLSKKEEKDRAVRQELKAIDLALSTFDRVGNLNEGEGPSEFSELATEFYRGLLPEREAELDVRNDVVTVNFTDSGRHLLSQLSTGTMHETLIAVRLAALQTIDPGKKLPLILDDVFTNFDEGRLTEAMEYLRKTGRQAILFSCQLRDRRG